MIGARMNGGARRISNRARLRAANQAIDLGNRATMILMAVLAQSGGEVVVTQGTIDQVGVAIRHGDADYAIVDGANPNEHIVRLVIGHADAPLAPTPEATKEQIGE